MKFAAILFELFVDQINQKHLEIIHAVKEELDKGVQRNEDENDDGEDFFRGLMEASIARDDAGDPADEDEVEEVVPKKGAPRKRRRALPKKEGQKARNGKRSWRRPRRRYW